MTRFTSIHEDARYEVLIRGIRSRAEAEAIVLAVERLPASDAWIAPPEPPVAPDNHPALRDESENVGGLLAGTAT